MGLKFINFDWYYYLTSNKYKIIVFSTMTTENNSTVNDSNGQNSLVHDNNNEVFTISKSKVSKAMEGKKMDFDDLLPYVGEFGLYQKILFLLMIPFASFVAWVYFTQIFITLVPAEHWCKVPGLENLTVEQR